MLPTSSGIESTTWRVRSVARRTFRLGLAEADEVMYGSRRSPTRWREKDGGLGGQSRTIDLQALAIVPVFGVFQRRQALECRLDSLRERHVRSYISFCNGLPGERACYLPLCTTGSRKSSLELPLLPSTGQQYKHLRATYNAQYRSSSIIMILWLVAPEPLRPSFTRKNRSLDDWRKA